MTSESRVRLSPTGQPTSDRICETPPTSPIIENAVCEPPGITAVCVVGISVLFNAFASADENPGENSERDQSIVASVFIKCRWNDYRPFFDFLASLTDWDLKA